MNRQGQVTLFVIIAIILVGGILSYFVIRDRFGPDSVPVEFVPVYEYYLSCLEETSRQGINLLGEQGGYIESPEFESGSAYMPFSSQLDFLGQGVPYWMYVSGNNLLKEQVPTKKGMERELEEYVSTRVQDCDFTDFELSGFDVYVDEGSSTASINDLSVEIGISSQITMFRGDNSATVVNHNLKLDSKLGKFYKLALDVFNFEKSDAFLEKYAVDVMRLYAPVDGVELSCAPKFFVDEEIREDLVEGLEININSIKLDGDYYELASEEGKYFVNDVGFNIDEDVNFMYNPSWPTKIEIYGDRVAKPVGTQAGLSALGFCYVPYHLVYDISFPVMIQFFDSEELFQFPVSVIIDNNQPRESLPPTFEDVNLDDVVCRHKNSEATVNTYDSGLNPVEARLQFRCFNSICEIGETELEGDSAIFSGGVPQCVNGFIFASAEGYAMAKYQISTNSEDFANIVLRKKYEIDLDLGAIEGIAVVSFTGEDYSATVMYPETNSVVLVEGQYEVSVYVYRDSTLSFAGSNERMCVDVPVSGVGGLLGIEEEKCYDVNVPGFEVDMAVIGGGRSTEYIAESMLAESKELNLNVPLFEVPSSLDELQTNYALVEDSAVFLEFE